MGASGAGKTTLLNTIANVKISDFKVSGSVLVDSKNYGKDIKNLSAYVQQDDMFFGQLTAREHLLFNAIMYGLGSEAEARVDEMIKYMNLEPFKNTKIGTARDGYNLSGSERKRLSFASRTLIKVAVL